MSYYIRTRLVNGVPDWATACLVEVKSKEMRIEGDSYLFERETGVSAHKWVRAGRRHETPLWTDSDGRMRYAREGA